MFETLERNGIEPPTNGRARTTCPECSHKRRKRYERCLSVRQDGPIVQWKCHHCDWESSDVII